MTPETAEQGSPSADAPDSTSQDLSGLPAHEWLRVGRDLGLRLTDDLPREELQRRVVAQKALIERLDPAALLDVVQWARRPVRRSSSKQELARAIAEIAASDYTGLSPRGLSALAALRGLSPTPDEPAESIIRRLRKTESFGEWFARKRRGWAVRLLSHYFQEPAPPAGEYQFLPDDAPAGGGSLKSEIEQRGVVGGLASKLRGAADDYVRAKLDEIEARIDRKLDDIDRRLGEWRDREVANRLRIIRITVFASVLVALISLAYKFVAVRVVQP
jgi:hypothetical protein